MRLGRDKSLQSRAGEEDRSVDPAKKLLPADAPGEAVRFHSDGNDEFKSADDAVQDARHIGRSIIDGTHPDLSVLSLVSHHHHE